MYRRLEFTCLVQSEKQYRACVSEGSHPKGKGAGIFINQSYLCSCVINSLALWLAAEQVLTARERPQAERQLQAADGHWNGKGWRDTGWKEIQSQGLAKTPDNTGEVLVSRELDVRANFIVRSRVTKKSSQMKQWSDHSGDQQVYWRTQVNLNSSSLKFQNLNGSIGIEWIIKRSQSYFSGGTCLKTDQVTFSRSSLDLRFYKCSASTNAETDGQELYGFFLDSRSLLAFQAREHCTHKSSLQ